MDFADAYSRCCYGRLRTAEEYRPLVDAIVDGWDQRHDTAETTRHIGVLADFLGDEGDPRHLVLLRPPSHPPHGTAWRRLSHSATLPDGSRFHATVETDASKKLRLGVSLPGSHGVAYGVVHDAEFSPDEARGVVSQLPEPHAAEFTAFLDRHFGPRESQ